MLNILHKAAMLTMRNELFLLNTHEFKAFIFVGCFENLLFPQKKKKFNVRKASRIIDVDATWINFEDC